MIQRPSNFRLSKTHGLAKGLYFAALGSGAQASTMFDSGPFGYHAAMANMEPVTDWIPALNRWALDFGGTNELAATGTIAHGIGTGDFTWSAWAKPTSFTYARPLFANGTYAPTLVAANSSGIWYAYWGGSQSFSIAAVAGRWDHVAMVRRNGVIYLYVNGVLDGTSRAIATSMSAGAMIVGADRPTSPVYWIGSIADVLCHRRGLADSEIKQQADPSNVMCSGLILPPRRRVYAAVTAAPPPTGNRRRRLLIGACR